jgi:hypothetical protein
MATVARILGLRVAIYLNDHGPAHVHVLGSGHEAVFKLNCPGGPVELSQNYGVPKTQLAKIAAELAKHVSVLCETWRQIHGHF